MTLQRYVRTGSRDEENFFPRVFKLQVYLKSFRFCMFPSYCSSIRTSNGEYHQDARSSLYLYHKFKREWEDWMVENYKRVRTSETLSFYFWHRTINWLLLFNCRFSIRRNRFKLIGVGGRNGDDDCEESRRERDPVFYNNFSIVNIKQELLYNYSIFSTQWDHIPKKLLNVADADLEVDGGVALSDVATLSFNVLEGWGDGTGEPLGVANGVLFERVLTWFDCMCEPALVPVPLALPSPLFIFLSFLISIMSWSFSSLAITKSVFAWINWELSSSHSFMRQRRKHEVLLEERSSSRIKCGIE